MTQRHTLVGFTEDLDWKPLQFVTPLPENILCSVCGLLRKTTALLRCGHVLCHFCFEQFWATADVTCPIDGEPYLEEHVEWRDFPDEDLLQREVKCWNESHGCTLAMAASEVHKHFHRECEYHGTPCPRCSRMVLIRDMREHLRASCHAATSPGASHGEGNEGDAVETIDLQREDGKTKKKTHWAESLLSWVSNKPKPPPVSSGEPGMTEGLSTVETGMLEAVRAVLQEAGDIKTLLLRALRDNEALNDSLTGVCQSVNSLKESVKQELAPVGEISEMTHCVFDGMSTLHGALSGEMADIKNQTAEEFLRIRDAIESAKKDAEVRAKTMLEVQKNVLAYAEKNESRCDFFIPGIELLEALAMNGGNPAFYHEKVYLRGYKISPGVELKRKGRSVSLEMGLQLHRGDHDDEIQWPFEHKIRFSILHPVEMEEQVFIDKTWPHVLEAFEKPTNSSNRFIPFNDCFDLGVLKSRGYICNGKLRVVMELL